MRKKKENLDIPSSSSNKTIQNKKSKSQYSILQRHEMKLLEFSNKAERLKVIDTKIKALENLIEKLSKELNHKKTKNPICNITSSIIKHKEKITKLKVSSVVIGLLGLIALFLSGVTGLSEEGSLLIGGLLALIGVQGLAISNITNKKDSQIIPAKTYLLTQWIAATLISIVLFNFLGGRVVFLTQLEILKLLGLVFIDIFNYSLFFYTIKRLSATFTTLVDYIVPIVGIIVGYIFLDEVISNIFFVTLTMIFISLYLAVKDELTNSRQAK